jgi:predicted RNase H-like HicB family nuclease
MVAFNIIQMVMNRAHYEILKDDNSYYGEIPDFDGVFANADSLKDCLLLRINKTWKFL